MKMGPKKVTIREPVMLDDSSPAMSENEDTPFLNRQELILSDSENVLQIPNTQAVEEAIIKEKKKKRKIVEEAQNPVEKKKKKIDVDQEMRNATILQDNNSTHISLLSLVLILWTKEFLLHSIMTLETLMSLSLKEKQYEAKRLLLTLTDSLLYAQKHLIAQKKELSRCSLKSLVTILLNSEWSTMFLDANVTVETSNWITLKYAENLQEPSSSSRTTATMFTSSTTAPTPIIPADVPSTNASIPKSIEDSLDELFQVGNSRCSTGSICQSICRRNPGSTCTITSPGERGFQVVKLDVYDFSKICKKPKTEWWKEANYRSTFLTQSPMDPNYQLVMKLLVSVTNQLNKIPGIKKEERETKS